MHYRRSAGAVLLSLGLGLHVAYSAPPVSAGGGQAQNDSAPAILRISVREGEGLIHTAGTRSNQAIVILVADETGRPVEGASVSIRLPEEGPTGLFATGMRTEIAVTGPDGRVSIRGIQWARVAGPTQLQITANKGEARAGAHSTQYIAEPSGGQARRGADPASSPARAPARIESPSRSKWILVAALIGGAAAGGVAAAANRGSSAPGAPPSSAPPAITAPTVSIGGPIISVGKP